MTAGHTAFEANHHGTRIRMEAYGPPDPYLCIEIYDHDFASNAGHIHIRSDDDRRALAAVLLAGLPSQDGLPSPDERIRLALARLDAHRHRLGSKMETECMCPACQMGRILRSEGVRT